MNPPDQPCQATPAGDLRQQIIDSRVPKNEREWWASREIEKLERELTAARSERDLAITRVACILWSGAIDKHTCGDVQKWADYYIAELTRLRAEVERLTTKIGNQADRIRYLEGATNHATGTPLSQAIARAEKAEAELAEAKVERETIAQSSLRSLEAYIDKLKQFAERAEKAEADNAKWQKLLLMSRDDREIDLISEIEEQARLLGMSGEREADILGKLGRLESELAAIKNGHGELGKYEQLRLKNAELQAELANIANAKPDTWGDMSDSFQAWAQNRARHALAAMKGTP